MFVFHLHFDEWKFHVHFAQGEDLCTLWFAFLFSVPFVYFWHVVYYAKEAGGILGYWTSPPPGGRLPSNLKKPRELWGREKGGQTNIFGYGHETSPVLFGNMEGWELTSSNQGFKLESSITSSPKSWTMQKNVHKEKILWYFYYFLLDKMSVCYDIFSPCSSCHGILVQTPQFLFNKL